MRSLFLLLLIFGFAMTWQRVDAQSYAQTALGECLFQQDEQGFLEVNRLLSECENPRMVAIALDLTLGLFGMHRLYLGTDVKVPVAYTLTFGGGGVLWLVDLALLIGSPNIDSYKNNPHVFMWIPPTNTHK